MRVFSIIPYTSRPLHFSLVKFTCQHERASEEEIKRKFMAYQTRVDGEEKNGRLTMSRIRSTKEEIPNIGAYNE
jgi:hypothetical protein